MAPIIHTLKTHWPQTRLTWIIGAREAQLVGDLPGVEFITFDKRAGLQAYRDLRRRLNRRRFEVLLHMQAALRASLASRCVVAPLRIGFDRARGRDFQGLFVNRRIPAVKDRHVIECFFSFLEVLGLRQRELRWDIPIPAEARTFAAQQLAGARRCLIISPCSSHPRRNWLTERYARVADYATERWNMRVALCGGASEIEREYGNMITRQMRHPVTDLIGKTSIKQLLALLARADAVVSPDSGPAHLATCVDTPVVGLYAATNPARGGPYLSQRWCVDRYDAAARRYRQRPAARLAWGTKLEYPGVMGLIEVDEVIAKLDELLG